MDYSRGAYLPQENFTWGLIRGGGLIRGWGLNRSNTVLEINNLHHRILLIKKPQNDGFNRHFSLIITRNQSIYDKQDLLNKVLGCGFI